MKFSPPILLGILTIASASAQGRDVEYGADSAKTVDEIKKSDPFAIDWKEATYADRKYLFAVTSTGMGESYVDVHGWIYNRSFKEWRRIMTVKTRRIGKPELLIDSQKGIVSLRDAGGRRLKDVEVLRFDLRATDDDAAYVK